MVPGLVLAHESRAVKASIALFPGLQVGGPACACEETEFSGPVWQVRCAEDGVVQRAEKEEVLMADKNLFLPGTKVGFKSDVSRGQFLVWRSTKWTINADASLSPAACPQLVLVYEQGFDREAEERLLISSVCQVLPEPWKSCDSFQIKERLADFATLKLEAEGVPPICVHLQRAVGKDDEAEKRKAEKIHEILASKGLAPKRLASTELWWVEAWESKGAPGKADASDWTPLMTDRDYVEKCGRLLAKLHSIEPAWYEEHLAFLKKQYPELKDVPASSHLWSYQSFNNKRHQFGREADLALGEQALKMFLEAGANPVSEIGSRTVTVHGDFLPSNMLYTEDGLQLIDFETASSGQAVADISYAFSRWVAQSVRPIFVRAYLEELKGTQDIAEEDVKALQLDGERCVMKYGTNPLTVRYGLQIMNGFPGAVRHSITLHNKLEDGSSLTICAAYDDLCKLADQALEDPAIAQDILDRGFEKVARQVVWNHGRAPLHYHAEWPGDYTGELTWLAGFVMGCLYTVGFLK
ncbi:unnamed protein product [Effrenium voratum]|uniref:Aminoglycoside phosphotransferase domain-containing protein n=1 Tax=Effrenium voratum TaxID=2562239 RepID=A0AA36JBD6_9DINO|nr:unnamed protein product [Effrenium voratum]CAJ1429672.1 unnamed protein product [Effrenium voratum]